MTRSSFPAGALSSSSSSAPAPSQDRASSSRSTAPAGSAMRSKSTTPLTAPSAPSGRPWKPHAYQKKALKFILEREASALFLTPGLGKTSISYAALKVLRSGGQLKGALVVAPRRPAVSVWPQERDEWADFHELDVAVLHGPRKDYMVQEKRDVYVVTHEGLRWLIREGHLAEMFKKGWINVLILDELSKFKNTGSKRYKELKPWLKKFDRRIGLTGSPASNGLLDLFGQAYVLDLGYSLGQYVTHFRFNFFTPVNPSSDYPVLVPKPGAEELIYARMKNLAIRIDADDHVQMPQVIVNYLKLDLEPKARQVYDDMETDMFALMASNAVVTAETAAAASMKCRQLTSGAIYEDRVDAVTGLPHAGKRKWHLVHDQKIDATLDLVEELQGQQLLVAYEFGHERERLIAALGEGTPCIGGGTSDKRALEYERAWNAREIPVLVGHPASMGHGLNFQKGDAYNILWVSGTWDYELYDQFNRRLRRQGSKASHLFLHHLVFRDTVDEAVVSSMLRKRKGQDALHDALNIYAKRRRLSV